jgi:hypothetical protein
VVKLDLLDDELAAVVAALRRLVDEDKFPHARRLDALRVALGKLEATTAARTDQPRADTDPRLTRKVAAEEAGGDKRARSAKAPAPKISPGFKLGRLPPDR